MTPRLYPLTFTPQFRDYLWGGRSLEQFGRQLPPGIVAESWEISGHPSSPTAVDAGAYRGRLLTDLVTELGLDLVGRRSQEALARGKFPLLVKLLDAQSDLSVQVHPDDAYALAHEGGELGKTEMWYVLRAEPGARLIYGLRRGVTPAQVADALRRGAVDEIFAYLPVQAGDAIFVPAGTVHALMAGLVVVEIQQNSDTTYRIFDWGRLGPDSQPRALHIDKALAVIDYTQVEPGVYPPRLIAEAQGVRREEISRCRYFTVEKVTMAAGARYVGTADGETFEVWGCLSGAGMVTGAFDPVALPAIRFTLLPAALGRFAVEATQEAVLLRAYV